MKKPFYDHNGIRIHLGDCRDILPTLPPVDLIASDVSYSVQSGGSGEAGDRSPSGILGENDGKIFEHNDICTKDYVHLFFEVLKNPSHCYVFINNDNLKDALNDFNEVGFKFHNLLTWDKGNCTPNGWYMKCSEAILMFRKGKAFRINDQGSKNVLRYPNPKSPKLHPTEKSLGLMFELLVNSSEPRQTILDPFCGSGATLVAARLANRQAIGIDIDPNHCETAAQYLRWREVKIEMGFSTQEIMRDAAKGEQREPGLLMQGKLL